MVEREVIDGDSRNEVGEAVFHPGEELYTLLRVDPDVPNERDQFSVREIDEPIYGEERNECEKFRGFIDLPSSKNIDENERLRRMGPRKGIENEKLPLNYQHPCVIPWKLAVKNQKMDWFEIQLDESCLTGLTAQRTELVCSLRMIQRGLRMEGLEGRRSTFNSSNRITPTARPDLGTATIQ
ncbi:hypothetical protein BY996DRAFT_6578719 [Phakopsora pachyrhizi]|nr:hypothetical protein BY996DRAFT_6578719 [Phakopsora pachyrhizi]